MHSTGTDQQCKDYQHVLLFDIIMRQWLYCVCQVYSVSRNGQLFSFQCDTHLSDLIDVDLDQHHDASLSSSDEDVEPQHAKKRKGD